MISKLSLLSFATLNYAEAIKSSNLLEAAEMVSVEARETSSATDDLEHESDNET
jgi:hypothetical protein